LLASLVSGGSVVCPSQFDGPRVFQWIDTFAPTWYTAVPTIHQAMLTRAAAHRDVIARRRLRFIRSASAALPAAVRLALEAAFDAPVIEAYGMTEASHQIAANPLPPGVRKPGSVGVPSGTEAAIMNEHGEVVPPLTPGEIVIRGANVIRAYDGPAVASAFVDDWLRTGDAGYTDEDGYLFITCRLKEVINRGGEKINPKEVDEVLLGHPAVAQAATFPLPHHALGQDVAAAVVVRAGRTCSEQALREFVAARLAPCKVPARIQFVDRLPTGPTGKVQRSELAVQLGLDASTARPARPPHVAPDTSLERRLAGIWTSALGVGDVGLHDNFFELGGDSILAARVLGLVREEFNLEFSLLALFDRPVFCDMARTIASSMANDPVDAGHASPGEPSRPPAITPIARDAFRARRVRSRPLQPRDPEAAR
jgi:oxalate---CoA ligase